MSAFDLGPFYRSAIGYDRVLDLLQDQARATAAVVDSYPPYDIEKTGDNSYRETLAVAGFAPEDIAITAQPNLLTVTGKPTQRAKGQYFYQGVTARSFERRFDLADYIKVGAAELRHGLLSIDLTREIPEAMKPRKIDIRLGAAALENKAA